jgi:tetratricopeptide (TPR) repeat protein
MHADGWINLARAYLQDGDVAAADSALKQADQIRPRFHKTLYFRALSSKAKGEYDSALQDLRAVAREFPTDRVVLNQIGRILFLDSQLADAVPIFQEVLSIDPEDLMAHYNLMLTHRALGHEDLAAEHEARYRRFKADETSRAISRAYRLRHPADNNEALAIHEH